MTLHTLVQKLCKNVYTTRKHFNKQEQQTSLGNSIMNRFEIHFQQKKHSVIF